MTVQSFTGLVDTNGEWVTVSSVSGVTFTSENTYTLQANNSCYLKVADAEFTVLPAQVIQFKAGNDDLYIKTDITGYPKCTLTVLEHEAA